MAIELCKTNRNTGESQFIPICTAEVFTALVLPPAKELQLEMIECLPGLCITAEFKEQFLGELLKYRAWVVANVSGDHRTSLLESLERISEIITNTSLDQFDLSTG
jgi:hypothetical protein